MTIGFIDLSIAHYHLYSRPSTAVNLGFIRVDFHVLEVHF